MVAPQQSSEHPEQVGGGNGHSLISEETWAGTGEKLAVVNMSEKLIEEKERQLRDCIATNYSRIKDVEKELASLQLQLKVNVGPKKSALEMIRRKIEAQNERVVEARARFVGTRKVAEAAEECLKTEERVKEQLCQELNLLVQHSAHAQLDKLEQLTRRLESLGASGGYGSQAPAQPSASASAGPRAMSPADMERLQQQVQAIAQGEELASTPRPQARVGATTGHIVPGVQTPEEAGSPVAKREDDRPAPKKGGSALVLGSPQGQSSPAASAASAARKAEGERQAAAARSRHVAIGASGGRGAPNAGARPAVAAAPPPGSSDMQSASGRFQGFDN